MLMAMSVCSIRKIKFVYKKMPKCKAHHDCFANQDGVCHCLNDNNFNGKDCPFYKIAVHKEQNGGRVYENQEMQQ